jgi:hypothetical protein
MLAGSEPVMGVPEDHLLARCRNGDVEAFGRIYAEYEQGVFRHAYRLLGSHEDALDACQETFVKAFHALRSFRGLRAVTESRQPPPGFEFEKLTGYEPNDQVTFEVWSVRLRVPRAPDGTFAIILREQMIRSRLIGPEERKVIHEWSGKERNIGSFERVEFLRKFYEARKQAAERDRAENGVRE